MNPWGWERQSLVRENTVLCSEVLLPLTVVLLNHARLHLFLKIFVSLHAEVASRPSYAPQCV